MSITSMGIVFIVLAVLALALPFFAVCSHGKRELRSPWLLSAASYICFAGALCAQLLGIRARCLHGDFSGIQDTIDAALAIAIVLSVVVMVLNLWSLGLYYVKEKGEA